MQPVFAGMFMREPDEIAAGDYYLKIDEKTDEFIKQNWKSRNEQLEHYQFLKQWRERSLQNENIEHWPWTRDEYFKKTVRDIAASGRPFMDIASSDVMGLAAFILKENTDIKCLVTDRNRYIRKSARAVLSR